MVAEGSGGKKGGERGGRSGRGRVGKCCEGTEHTGDVLFATRNPGFGKGELHQRNPGFFWHPY